MLRQFPNTTASGTDGYFEIPKGADEYVMFDKFRADPVAHKLTTPSGRIELYSEKIAGFGYDNCPPHAMWIEPSEWHRGAPAEKYPLHLVSSQPRYKLHSQMDPEGVSARGKIDGREAITMHPDDAQQRGIKAGDVVRVHNARGACLAGVVLSDMLSPGVAKLSCGAWYDPADDRRRRALRARQRQCAHPRSRHLEAQPGAVDRHQHGRDRIVERTIAAAAGVRAAGDLCD